MKNENSKKGYDLKINILNSEYVPPEANGYTNVWFNMFGVEEADYKLVEYLAQICEDNKEAKKLIINANEKIKEQLKIFAEVHDVRFIK